VPQRITELTPAQIARFGEWTQRWIEIGLSTEPADFDRATTAALRCYELADLKRPMVILHMGSPYGATPGGTLAWVLLRKLTGVQSRLESQVESQVASASQVRSQLESQVESQVESQITSQLVTQVESQVWIQVAMQVERQVRSQIGNKVGSPVDNEVWGRVWRQAESQLGSQVRSYLWSHWVSEVWSQAWSSLDNLHGGAFWASWGAHISYCRDVAGWCDPVLERFEIDEDLMQSCGWAWWHDNVLAISDRPSAINRDSEGRLHCETGPSIVHRDGWSLWHAHGVPVPQDVIERSRAISVGMIDQERNAEVRRVMIDRYRHGEEVHGAAAYIRDAGGIKLDHDERFGTLWRRNIPNDEPIVMLEVVNATREPTGEFKRYWLRVPPEMTTAHEAVAWTFGRRKQDYAPTIET
jgi:uncharacterized protein DUF6745